MTGIGGVQLTSVWEGDDGSFLDAALSFYPSRPVERILDCTINAGRFWKESRFRQLVTGMDIDPGHQPDLVDDNRVMAAVKDATFDVVVYDPPHVPNQGRDRQKDFCQRFGLGGKAGKEAAYSFARDYEQVATQARRVLKPGGLFLAKVIDFVHNHRYRWALLDLVRAVQDAGMTPCDLVVKVRQNPIIDPKWKNRHHARRRHAYWLIARNSTSCERKET